METLNTTKIPLSKCTPSSVGFGFRIREFPSSFQVSQGSPCSPCSAGSPTGFSCTRCARARVDSTFRFPAPKPESTIEFQTVYATQTPKHPNTPTPTTQNAIRRPRKTQRLLQFLCAIFYMRTKGATKCRLWLVKVKGWRVFFIWSGVG
ncbi:LOW QUALITY PROTEIN: uncharacterized protein LOC122614372 [Drosophila teissieri]|uniref:LOW QUALITY PROTEIN: uncharacterized protein LOC122614372 n=1 Tax=Drosophila teissieri TaxID=7243 RepID=UPI001CB9E519|nr:LOW QUALITY PROTEIN: uncharacterized protein LOC122614372 [Drosophila teissieri]